MKSRITTVTTSIILLLICINTTLAQVDSIKIKALKQELSTSLPDSVRIRKMIELGHEINEIDNSQEYLELTLQLSSLASKNNHYKGIIASKLYLATYYFFKGDYNEAIKNLNQNIEIQKQQHLTGKIGDVYLMLGNAYYSKADYDKAIEAYLKALEINEKNKDQESISRVLGNIGLLYSMRKQYKKAEEYFRKGINIDLNGGSRKQLANGYNNIGGMYQAQEQYDSALVYFNKSMEIYTKIDFKKGLAHGYNNIGIIFYYKGLTEKCLTYFVKSLMIRELMGNKMDIAQSLNNIGVFHSYEENYKMAIEYSKRSLDTAKKYGLKDEIIEALLNIGQASYDSKAYKNAAEYLLQYVDYKDSVISEQSEKLINEMEVKYQTNKKEKELVFKDAELTQQQLEIERQKFQQNLLYGGLGALLIIIGLYAYRFVEKKKSNQLLQQQKTAIENERDKVKKQKEIAEKQRKVAEIQTRMAEKQMDKAIALKNEIAERNKEISDSINYAQRLQQAILPSREELNRELNNGFVLFQPKDVVSGDFYWMEVNNDVVYFAAADCTGHGVPGAMVSIVCSNSLDRAVKEFELSNTGKILDKVADLVIKRFEKSGAEVKDGMDIALCALNRKKQTLQYSGANNPLWIVRQKQKIEDKKFNALVSRTYTQKNNEKILYEIKATKQPIGKYANRKPFEFNFIQLKKGDLLYIFTDGFADQFGGPKGKKFMYKPFKKLILSIADVPPNQQEILFLNAFNEWKQKEEQVDDVCVIGVKI